jgi:hypothetical protein
MTGLGHHRLGNNIFRAAVGVMASMFVPAFVGRPPGQNTLKMHIFSHPPKWGIVRLPRHHGIKEFFKKDFLTLR